MIFSTLNCIKNLQHIEWSFLVITVKRIGRTIGKAITVYENDTLNSLMTRIKEVFGQNDLTLLLTKNLGEITSIEQVFYICQMNVESVIFRVATSAEVADQ
jgi:4-hydroxybenzoate polyprenyltransferase